MNTNNQLEFVKDLPNKTILVTRHFDAPVADVWRAFTDAELLDQWWAPKPWKAETKTMDFKEGGLWLYAMVGPDGTRQWCRLDYLNIQPQKEYTAVDAFCDENGVPTNDMPSMNWHTRFEANGEATKVIVEVKFDSEADLEKILEMGFQEGFAAGLGNLEEYFAAKK